jgi:hypothetical protein
MDSAVSLSNLNELWQHSVHPLSLELFPLSHQRFQTSAFVGPLSSANVPSSIYMKT